MDLIITDQHSYRTDDPTDGPAVTPFVDRTFPDFAPQEVLEIFDAGKAYDGGRPPATIAYGGQDLPNPRKDGEPLTLFGAKQKAWFFKTLAASKAPWKIWGNSEGTLDTRTDLANLPAGMGKSWPGAGWASTGGGDWSGYITERGEIYDFVRDRGITGFAIVAGDRHSFWAGLPSRALPPHRFEPVGVEFITGSISAPGLVEAREHSFKADNPIRPLYFADLGGRPRPLINMTLMHGVKSSLEYARTGDLTAARRLSNPDVAPHLSFLDMGGHGYAVVRVAPDSLETEFVCIPRPVTRATTPDGGPLVYRVRHRARLWSKGERPRLEQTIVDGNPELSI
jgi:alkaline phosphatase D